MSDHVQSLARGLSAIRTLSTSSEGQTLSQVADAAGLPRATARRLLLTLESEGFVRSQNGRFN